MSLLSVNTGYWLGVQGENTVACTRIEEEEIEKMGKF